ncbi:hypothetical protein [Streptomyces sp. NBC_00690]|uniref:hypothetical protein n=1 Tax=Streptomyces sp. NBC_00690 TaxID=2975808 RepID=UPI002E2A403B|nr:hypothetical protein [Streptomyces sp. NBC_00690]
MGPGEPDRGEGLLPLASGRRAAEASALATPERSGPVGRRGQAVRTVGAHSETVLRSFYDFHRDIGTGPVLNPFPLDRARRGRRAHAHRNPMDPARKERAWLYRPRVPNRVPRSVPDEEFNEIFARLPSHRDRALVAFYVSTGARASELLSTWQAGVDPGRQLISVVRKGTREVQELPSSTDGFVWLRLFRCSLLRPDPAQRSRLTDIRDNLIARIAEAEREGWLGEVEGLQVSLTGAQGKLDQLDAEAARRPSTVDLGMPTFADVAIRTTTTSTDQHRP